MKLPRILLSQTRPPTRLIPTTTLLKQSKMSILTSIQPPSLPQPQFSSNSPENILAILNPLLKTSKLGGRWKLTDSGKGIERKFVFRGFKKCWEFMNLIAPHCTKEKHHPEWSNIYNTTFIRWTTHNPSGLSTKDILMAKFCDEMGEKCGELIDEKEVKEDGDDDIGKQLVDTIEVEAGDCCVPKKTKG